MRHDKTEFGGKDCALDVVVKFDTASRDLDKEQDHRVLSDGEIGKRVNESSCEEGGEEFIIPIGGFAL